MCIPKIQHGKQAVQHKRSLLPVCIYFHAARTKPGREGRLRKRMPETRVRGISSVAEEENTFFCYRLLINN